MIRSVNLPGFQEELVDGGLAVTVSNIASDVIVVIGFSATGKSSADYLINEPILITKGDQAEFVYGKAEDGATVSQAVYEVSGAGANNVYVMSLGQWGSATFTDPNDDTVYQIFDGGTTINIENYFKALDNAYDLLANKNVDIILAVDAFAFDRVADVNGSGRDSTFVYQGAFKCYEMSSQNHECISMFNLPPAVSGTLSAVRTYVGTAPTTDEFGVITTSGTGILSIPELAGAPSGYPGYTVLPGLFASNFDLNSDKYGTPPLSVDEISTDRKGNRVDIGRYASVIAEEPTFANSAFSSAGITNYNGLGATAYAGLVSILEPYRAATNKPVAGITGLRYTKSIHQRDLLDGVRVVTFKQSNRGILVSDDPTMARAGSDYAKLQVLRIVLAAMKMVRLIADPYIGEPNSPASQSAMNTSVRKQLDKFIGKGLTSYDFKIVVSDTDRVLGNFNIFLTLVPETEIREIKAVVTMASNI